MPNTYPAQVAFFLALRTRLPYPNWKPIVRDTMRLLALKSEKQAYQRIRGTVRLTYEEGALLAQHYKLALRLDHSDEPPWAIGSVHEVPRLHEELTDALRSGDRLLFGSTEIPVFYLFEYPVLTALKLHFWQHYASEEHYLPVPPFTYTPDAFEADPTYRHLRSCAALYRQIPREEIWMIGMLDNLLYQLITLHEQQAIAPELTASILATVDELIDTLYRTLADPAFGQLATVHYNEQSSTSGRVVRVNAARDTIYLTGVDLHITKVVHPQLYAFYAEEWRRQCGPGRATVLSGRGRRDRELFFRRLRIRTKHTARELHT